MAQENNSTDKKGPSPKYKITKFTNHELEITISSRTYQLTNVKLRKLNDFSFTLKLIYGNAPPFIDTVNLTKSKSRVEFIHEAKDFLALSTEIIKNDLNVLMHAIEKLQRENIEQLEQEKILYRKNYTMTPAEEKRAKDILSSRDLFKDDLLKDMEKIGYVGDELGKQILYLAGTSRKLNKPISVLSVANSSAGKSYAQDTILSLFPDDERINLTRMTPKSLSHFSKYEIQHQLICIDELNGIDSDAMSQVRSMLSRGFISLAYTSIDRLTGKMETLQKEVYGPVALFTSTTHEELIDDETRNRFLILPVDESAEQTYKVMKSIIYQNTRKGVLAQKEKKIIQRKFKAVQKCLMPVHIIIPDDMAKSITFNNDRISYKRKFTGYLSILQTIALHRQYQRKNYIEKGPDGKPFKLILIKKQDVIDTNKIITDLFGPSFGELNPVNAKCLGDIIQFCKQKAKETQLDYWEVFFTRREVREYAGWEHMPLRRAIEKLFEMEYIIREYGAERSRHYYKLNINDNDNMMKGVNLKVWSPRLSKESAAAELTQAPNISGKSGDNNNIPGPNEGNTGQDGGTARSGISKGKKSKTGSKTETGSPKKQTGSKEVDPVFDDDWFKTDLVDNESMFKNTVLTKNMPSLSK